MKSGHIKANSGIKISKEISLLPYVGILVLILASIQPMQEALYEPSIEFIRLMQPYKS